MTLQLEALSGENVQRRVGRLDRYQIANFTELTSPQQVEQAHKIHGAGYVAEGFVKPSALLSDGTLPPDIDKARGANVDYYLSSGWDVDSANSLTTAAATMRKINIPLGGSIEDLPAYRLCDEVLDPAYKDFLLSVPNAPKNVKEIGALARTRDASPAAVFELFRDALQDGREKGEVWFFSIVSSTYASLANNFGDNAIRRIGEDISFSDDRINEGITLVPAMVHTESFIDEIRQAIDNSSERKQTLQYMRSFMFFTEGLGPESLTPESAELREQLQLLSSMRQRSA